MGSKSFQFLSRSPLIISHKSFHESSNIVVDRRCFSGGQGSGSRWDWDAKVNLNQRSRLNDAYLRENDVDEEDFEFRNAEKSRVWWFDDVDEVNDEEEGSKGFGVLEASIGFTWISKVLQAFGWMIPAVITSLVLGTREDSIPGSIFMALALSLGQTALSLITEKLWKDPTASSRPKNKSKRKPFRKAAANSRPRKQKETNSHKERRSQDYKSWVVASSTISSETGKKNSRDFGGWDELDNHVRLKRAQRDG